MAAREQGRSRLLIHPPLPKHSSSEFPRKRGALLVKATG
jgi:hypothetical protein